MRDHLPDDEPDPDRPLEVEFTVPTHDGERTIHLKYPAGTLPTDTRPVDLADWPDYDEDDEDDFPVFDRRAMEGMMRMFAPDYDDPKLQKAQDLMYQAWEETNPAQRLILAHEALTVSADCADAYVLLAEEEADTVGRALEYYRQGVAAGERALGKAFFEEHAGYFWGLMETRPYMRARQGLANILWELSRGEESVAHYQDMLRLNPGDNQGIRYSLLNLLLSLNRDPEARDLLRQYQEDGSAEWLYTKALMAFRQGGASRNANKVLHEAMQLNPYVPAYLTGQRRLPGQRPAYVSWGDESEAVVYASGYLSLWRRTAEAIDWLKEHQTGSRAVGSTSKQARRKPKKQR